jgi:outer membrane receptor for ferrienterochelin and colicins
MNPSRRGGLSAIHDYSLSSIHGIRSAALLLGLLATTAAHAGASDQMVVTATGFEQKIADAPASVSLISREELARRPYTSLIDALRDIEGIDVGMESTDKNGMATLSLRGMPSDYTLVLIDGRRQSNAGDLYPNNFGGGQFSYLPPLDAVERIEVVRGPMSTLYGSDAMGGVINIITRKVSPRWLGALTQGGTFQQSDQFGDDRTTDGYLAGPLLPGKLGLAVRGSYYRREQSVPDWAPLPLPSPPNDPGSQWERSLGFGGGGRQVGHWNKSGGIRLSFTPGEAHELMLDMDLSRQKYDNSEGQTGTLDSIESLWRSGNATVANPDYDPSLPDDAGNPSTLVRRVVQPRVGYADYQRYERDQLALTHVGRWSFGTSRTSLMRSMSNNLGRSLPLSVAERGELQSLWNEVCVRRGLPAYCNNGSQAAGIAASELTADELAGLNAFLPRERRILEMRNLVLDSQLDLALGARHQLTVGGQYFDAQMEDGAFGLFGDGVVAGTTQPHRQWALFAEDNWDLAAHLTLTAGARYDHHNFFGSQLSPRAYLVWRADERWTVKGGVSTGYKTPKPNQLFPGITGFGGQGVSPFVGTPGLQPETSTNTELAAYYTGGVLDLNVTVFHNRFKDKIATGDDLPNCEVAAPGQPCVDVGPGWADLGYRTFRQSTNIDRAETRGLELAGSLRLPAGFGLRGNYTLTESEQKSGARIGRPIAGNPARHMLNATLNWQATAAISLALQAEARSKRYRTTLEDGADQYYQDYNLLHLGGAWQATPHLTLNARINNLLDKNFIAQTCLLSATQDSYSCSDDFLIKDKRRSLWLSANFSF